MKKLLKCLAILAFVLLLGMPVWADSVTTSLTKITNDYFYITYSWTCAADGSLTAVAHEGVFGYIILVVTDPGSTTPDDNYDITLTDAHGVDILGGEGADRDQTNTEQIVPKIDTSFGARFVNGSLTLDVTDNTANGATGTVYVYMVK